MTASFRLQGNAKKLLEPVTKMWTRRKEFMVQVGDSIIKETHNRIDKTKTAPDGSKWTPWAAATRKARAKDGTIGKGLLNRTGKLRNSIRATSSDSEVVVTSNASYGRYLQYGTSNMPARPFIGIGKNEEKAISDIWKRWFRQ